MREAEFDRRSSLNRGNWPGALSVAGWLLGNFLPGGNGLCTPTKTDQWTLTSLARGLQICVKWLPLLSRQELNCELSATEIHSGWGSRACIFHIMAPMGFSCVQRHSCLIYLSICHSTYHWDWLRVNNQQMVGYLIFHYNPQLFDFLRLSY